MNRHTNRNISTALKVLAGIAAFLIVYLPLSSQKARAGEFPLKQPITEQFIGCLVQQDAVDIINAKAKSETMLQTVTNDKEQADVCRFVRFTITYHELVYETVGTNGEILSV